MRVCESAAGLPLIGSALLGSEVPCLSPPIFRIHHSLPPFPPPSALPMSYLSLPPSLPPPFSFSQCQLRWRRHGLLAHGNRPLRATRSSSSRNTASARPAGVSALRGGEVGGAVCDSRVGASECGMCLSVSGSMCRGDVSARLAGVLGSESRCLYAC
jgi:hypothetical protein